MTSRRLGGGLGIGLSLVQRLVEMHGGRVEAHSSLGHGSEFVVRLPTIMPPDSSRSTTSRRSSAEKSSLRVLVVDDNVDAATTVAMLLKAAGHDVRTANDGPTGIEEALDYRPDVIFLDIGLPKLDGYEVARQLRKQPALQETVLIALTGYGTEKDVQRSREAGFNHHLVKPVNYSTLMAALGK